MFLKFEALQETDVMDFATNDTYLVFAVNQKLVLYAISSAEFALPCSNDLFFSGSVAEWPFTRLGLTNSFPLLIIAALHNIPSPTLME